MNIETILLTVAALFVAGTVASLVSRFRHAFTVAEGLAGLLYRDGKFIERLGVGRHVRWGRRFALTTVDLRRTQVAIAGQEVLTVDNVGLKLTLAVTYQVTDPALAAHTTQSWYADLYHLAQLALRAEVAAVPVETLLGARLNLGPRLLARLQPEAARLGLAVHAAEVKDVMFPAELKRAFADVLKAKQEGQAALERARGESAALRNLANAARLLDGNPALQNLRLLQSLTGAQAAGSTLVLGLPGGFVPLKGDKPLAPTAPNNEGG
jgi:regulator of protease activity HflC (stomatin/prohibitin superfamily)